MGRGERSDLNVKDRNFARKPSCAVRGAERRGGWEKDERQERGAHGSAEALTCDGVHGL